MSKALLVIGLGFGDEGKGSIVDFLVRHEGAKTVVRFNGGAQAAHNVVTADGRHHTFSQFGSGTFAGADTFLSRFMLVNPISMRAEEKHLQSVGITDAFDRLSVEEGALITNPFQVAINRLREMARDNTGGRHGSCGMGIGETVADALAAPGDALRAQDLRDPDTVRKKLLASQRRKQEQARALVRAIPTEADGQMQTEWEVIFESRTIDYAIEDYQQFIERVRIVDDTHLGKLLKEPGPVIFEGAQGVLLDQAWGLFPHVTRSNTTFGNALELLGGHSDLIRIGVFRSYFTRHGVGPFPTEDRAMEFPDHNRWGPWQQGFRFGHFDLALANYALRVVHGIDVLALTCLDHVEEPQVAVGYTNFVWKTQRYPGTPGESPQDQEHLDHQRNLGERLAQVKPLYSSMSIEALAQQLGSPIGILSRGPTAEDKTW